MIGKRFGRITVIEKLRTGQFACKCDCGRIEFYSESELENGNVETCGKCKDHLKAMGMSKTRIYKIWYKMAKKSVDGFVCDEWKNSFKTFYEWSLENGYDENSILDRIDRRFGYNPENCEWR